MPPGPEKLFDLGFGIFLKINSAINRSRPGVDQRTPWPLSAKQQREMEQAVAMLREAADQGHMLAQAHCGMLYGLGGHGVAKDDRLDFVYSEKAAQQGDVFSQFNTGNNYHHGLGCEQSHERAAQWFGKAVDGLIAAIESGAWKKGRS